MAGNPAAVQVKSLDKLFGSRKVLDGLSLTVGQGEFVALLGRSGSGKSTFLRVLGALDADVSGQVHVPARRAIVFQDPRLLPWQRVLRNVTVGLPQDRSTRQRAAEALDEVGLARHAQAWPRTLSGGEAQRAALARALVREPQLLLLDEPFGALDALTRLRMHVLLRNLYERHRPAVLLVTHDVDEAMLLADRVLVLTDGSISFDEHVGIDDPVRRNSPRFDQLRDALLQELGVAQA
ncbi:ABC transporter ATP-binding protein [Advenella mimigardefordensis]|uniref:Aliphatic sulfonates import ATP-binding protein SsuB n=1 Tax=Advenella mimigardefordensis (strain DSM 17166 / LMG 22922 / DPN7) TaxID=1247726 RepID=W0PAQ3_ADVMD|nr:ABC transporter ATP-binding protein [Advenella mimigardefordensis]AHG62500.1 aliphatic sulfonates import ATP-binding protein SsuB [Advenella mimigardefordensis DPN7]